MNRTTCLQEREIKRFQDVPDLGEERDARRNPFAVGERQRVADDLQDALSSMLVVDDAALGAGGQHSYAEALALAVAERLGASLDKDESGHHRSPDCIAATGMDGCGIRSRGLIPGEKET